MIPSRISLQDNTVSVLYAIPGILRAGNGTRAGCLHPDTILIVWILLQLLQLLAPEEGQSQKLLRLLLTVHRVALRPGVSLPYPPFLRLFDQLCVNLRSVFQNGRFKCIADLYLSFRILDGTRRRRILPGKNHRGKGQHRNSGNRQKHR